jgi:asparagine synthase (glutamine-hydrolysing)
MKVWGTDLFKGLRGMFAFVIWDGAEEKLVFARDHFGEKSLFTPLNRSDSCLARS